MGMGAESSARLLGAANIVQMQPGVLVSPAHEAFQFAVTVEGGTQNDVSRPPENARTIGFAEEVIAVPS